MQTYDNPVLVTQMIRHVLAGQADLTIERVAAGASTAVYRVSRAATVLYVRVLPEKDASFAPEASVHRLLRARALHVPEVLHVEPLNALLHRSVMFTTAIAGQAIGSAQRPAQVAAIVRDAGRELASLNQVAVEGFGWIRRSGQAGPQLCAEYATHQEWLRQHFAPALPVLSRGQVLPLRDTQAARAALVEAAALFATAPAVLAHGDFDTTHIHHQDGRYTGMIDFGEIRGTHPLYDVGHFAIECSDLLTPLLEGYGEVAPLPADYLRRIHLSTVLIATRRLGRRLAKQASVHEPDRQAIRRALRALDK